jgi:L-threonylcarbamoyladenylate synthase
MSQPPVEVNLSSRQRSFQMRKPDRTGIAAAVSVLAEGGLVGLPTETVYGLAADATNGTAVARIFEAKGRPLFNPLIAHVSSLDMALREGQLQGAALKLAEHFWPGPLTLVVPATATTRVSDLARAGLPTLALRWPDHPVAQELISAFGKPLAAPSANRSGRVSTTDALAVHDELGAKVGLILDGGACPVGVESTIIGWQSGQMILLRPGGLTIEEIEQVAGQPVVRLQSGKDQNGVESPGLIAPGMLASHYAPEARLILGCTDFSEAEAVLAFGPLPASVPKAARIAQLSEQADLREAAANLFRHLRSLDACHPKIIHAMPIPAKGLGLAICDRLRRAAAPREA